MRVICRKEPAAPVALDPVAEVTAPAPSRITRTHSHLGIWEKTQKIIMYMRVLISRARLSSARVQIIIRCLGKKGRPRSRLSGETDPRAMPSTSFVRRGRKCFFLLCPRAQPTMALVQNSICRLSTLGRVRFTSAYACSADAPQGCNLHIIGVAFSQQHLMLIIIRLKIC